MKKFNCSYYGCSYADVIEDYEENNSYEIARVQKIRNKKENRWK